MCWCVLRACLGSGTAGVGTQEQQAPPPDLQSVRRQAQARHTRCMSPPPGVQEEAPGAGAAWEGGSSRSEDQRPADTGSGAMSRAVPLEPESVQEEGAEWDTQPWPSSEGCGAPTASRPLLSFQRLPLLTGAFAATEHLLPRRASRAAVEAQPRLPAVRDWQPWSLLADWQPGPQSRILHTSHAHTPVLSKQAAGVSSPEGAGLGRGSPGCAHGGSRVGKHGVACA